MNVLFLSRYQFPYVHSGGTGVVVYELMRALRSEGHRVEHWTWKSAKPKSVPTVKGMVGFSPLTVLPTSCEKLTQFYDITLTNLSMARCLDETRPFDVIHVHTWELFLFGIMAKSRWKVPLIFTTHDIMRGDAPKEVNASDIYEFTVLGERALLSEANAIVCVSEENRKMLSRLYPDNRKKMVVVPNGVNVADFAPARSRSLFRKHKITLETPYVLFIGRAVSAKGLESVIFAARHLPERIPFVFAISTERWDGQEHHCAERYLKLIKSLAERRKGVHLIVNEWDRDAVAQLYSHAALTVMPSTYEPCGMVALESQACGTPIISNRIGFMRDCIEHGKTGILLDLDKNAKRYGGNLARAIEALYDDETKRRQFGKRAREIVKQQHSWESRARDHTALYSKMRAKP